MRVAGTGEAGEQALGRIEVGGWLERAGQGPRVGDAVQPERAVLAGVRVGARHVPAAGVDDESVGVHHAAAAPAGAVGVRDRDRPVGLDRGRDGEQDRAVRRGRRGRGRREREGAEDGVEPAGEAVREDPPDLGGRRLVGRRQSGPAARDQAEHHGERFVVGEHERRHAVAGAEPVTAVPAADRLDGHVEVDQVVHVAAHGPLVDIEPLGELREGPQAARLQQLQQREHAGSGSGHPGSISRIPGGICPVSRLAWPA